jgi:FkbM family methyltransferase
MNKLFRFFFKVSVDIYFPNAPYSIRKIRRFNRDLLLYINQHTCRKIYLGVFEKDETELLLDTLVEGDVCLDIGANIGYYTTLFASKASKVIAIEPIRQNVDLLRLTSSINKDEHVDIICSAVGREDGDVEFLESNESTLSGVYFTGCDKVSGAEKYTVASITIDSLNLPKLDIVKIDIEGYELFALEGMANTLKRLKPRLLMIELVDSYMNRFDASVSDVITFLSNYGYQANIIKNGKLESYVGNSIPNDNLFFTPNEAINENT